MSRKKRKSQRRSASVSRASAPSLSASVEFNPDYSYIIRDLKRIGTLAGAFLVILVALSFVL